MDNFNSTITLPISNLDNFKELLYLLYKDRSGFECALSREDQTLASKNIFLTYGEILPNGLDKLFNLIKPTMADSFVDLGSGAGKTVLQSYLCTDMKASYGVEIDPARCNLSQSVLAELKQLAPNFFNNQNKNKLIEFSEQNIIDFDFTKVSIVFSNATCFGPNLMGLIAEKVNSSPTVRVIMSLHKIEGLTRLTNQNIVDVEVSWHAPPATSSCYVYTQ